LGEVYFTNNIQNKVCERKILYRSGLQILC
jgi:hypothetical protein